MTFLPWDHPYVRRNPVRRNADDRLRALERAARAGDPQAKKAWVNHMVRSGQVAGLLDAVAMLAETPEGRQAIADRVRGMDYQATGAIFAAVSEGRTYIHEPDDPADDWDPYFEAPVYVPTCKAHGTLLELDHVETGGYDPSSVTWAVWRCPEPGEHE